MFLALLLIVFFQTFCVSTPIAWTDSNTILNRELETFTPSNTSSPMQTVVEQQHQLRTRFDILWSCVWTLFICSWVAIHPNVPPQGEGVIWSLWRRIKLMLWTLLVPELILFWAYRQWAAARYLAKLFQDEGWTPVHGHFLIMGGFTLVRPGEPDIVLDYESFLELLNIETSTTSENIKKDPRLKEPIEIAFPNVTAAEINDKAKGDFLSKAIFVLQLSWFILQCVVRGVSKGYAVTELELVTIALASLNVVVWYLWWDKPFGVKEPVKVYPANVDLPKRVIKNGAKLLEISRQVSSRHSTVSQLIEYIGSAFSSFIAAISSIFQISTYKLFFSSQRQNLANVPGQNYFWILYLPIYWLIYLPTSFAKTLFSIATTGFTAQSRQILHNHVPTFYAPPPPEFTTDAEFLTGFVIPPIIATMFGALHLIAWNFTFPSHLERSLWRISALSITIIPSAHLLLAIPIMVIIVIYTTAPSFALNYILKKFGRGFHHQRPQQVSVSVVPNHIKEAFTNLAKTLEVGGIMFLACAAFVAYVIARLLLLTLAVILLRKQPTSAFYAINWTRFLPHFMTGII